MMSTFPLSTKYINTEVFMQLGRYVDDSIAMKLVNVDGEPEGTATVCLAEIKQKPQDGHVFIKDWGENEGMYEGLKTAGIIGEAVRMLQPGFPGADAYECPLLVKLDDLRVQIL